jgi:hypothetical protein
VTVVAVSSDEGVDALGVEIDVLEFELDVVAAAEAVGLASVLLVTAVGTVAAAWCVPCWASITLKPTTPATLTVAMVALAVAIRRMPTARVVMATSYLQCLVSADRLLPRLRSHRLWSTCLTGALKPSDKFLRMHGVVLSLVRQVGQARWELCRPDIVIAAH